MKNTTASSPSLLGVILIAAITIGMYLAMSIYGGTLAENNGRIAPGKSKEILMKKVSNDTGKTIIEKQKKILLDKISTPQLFQKN